MLLNKRCPKCHGNIYAGSDYYGKYEECIQCGYTLDLDTDKNKKPVTSIKEKSLA